MKETFSSNTSGVLCASISLKTCWTRPDRLPVMPAVDPACDKSWQGNPAVTTSTSAGKPFSSAMSGSFWISPRRRLRTEIAGSQISQVKTVSCPAFAKPCSKPPIPAKRPAILMVVIGTKRERACPVLFSIRATTLFHHSAESVERYVFPEQKCIGKPPGLASAQNAPDQICVSSTMVCARLCPPSPARCRRGRGSRAPGQAPPRR